MQKNTADAPVHVLLTGKKNTAAIPQRRIAAVFLKIRWKKIYFFTGALAGAGSLTMY